MSEITHRQIETNGIDMHIAECGSGPVVLLCHGFPESWYSWRHQLPALAAAGYHAVAPDMRGYGRTSAPKEIDQYTILHLVGDMTGLLDKLGEKQAVIVGHDWGSMVAWTAAQIRPDRFRAVVGVSVPFFPRMPMRPLQLMKAAAGDNFMYILYFQEPGKAERELDADPRHTMNKLLYSASGSIPSNTAWKPLPKTAGFLDAMHEPPSLPSWYTAEDLDYYASEFKRAGFRGGLNWYRNFDRNWELTAPWQDAKITVPSLFIGGLRDGVVVGPGGGSEPSPMVKMMPSFCTDFRGSVLIPNSGHWTQGETPDELNRPLIDFLKKL